MIRSVASHVAIALFGAVMMSLSWGLHALAEPQSQALQSEEALLVPDVLQAVEQAPASAIPENPQIDFEGFVELAGLENDERARRRLPIDEFLEMSQGRNTILLDTRSAGAFAKAHLKGAVHLNFSDFTDEKLAKVIPTKQTRILIYCNNNFREADDQNGSALRTDAMALTAKRPPLALNVPTFINLRGYGYANVYELADVVAVDDPRVTFEGTAIKRALQ